MTDKNHQNLLGFFFGSRWLVLLGLSLVCLLAYANSFQNNFMLDDNLVIFGQRGVINKSFLEIFTTNQVGYYRPVGLIPLWFVSHMLGNSYIAYHLVSFFLFVLMVFFIFLIVRKLTLDPALSFFSAVLCAIHPINGMIVNYITASALAVYVLSMQVSFLLFMYFSENGRMRDYVLSLTFFVFACLSHEMAIMLPVYLATYLFFIRKGSWGKIFKLTFPFILILFGWAKLRSLTSFYPQQFVTALFVSKNMAASFSTWMDLVIWYVSNLIYPGKIIFLWSSQYEQEHILRNLILFVMASGFGIFFCFKWKRTWKSFLLILFALGFAPTVLSCFQSFPKVRPIIEPHWLYFTEFSYFVLLAWVLRSVVRKNFIVGAALSASVIFLLLVYCWTYNMEWKNQEKYSLYWLSLNKGNLTPYYGLGHSLMEKGDYLGAATSFGEGYGLLDYGTPQMAADWGHCLDMLGYGKMSLYWLKQAVQKDKEYALTYHYVGLYYKKRGNLLEAQRAFKLAVKLDPRFSPSRAFLKIENSAP